MKSNAQLQKDIYEELRWDPRVHEFDIGVTVNEGIITLTGTIPTYAEKWAAEEATERVNGVSAIVNKVEVKLPGGLVKDDDDIARTSVNALRWDVWVPQGKVKVHVQNGWVTLSGWVEWEFQKNSAEKALRNIEGVRGITNNLMLQQKTKASDVQDKIERALLRSAKEDAGNIKVSLKDNEVRLTGKVHSWSERKEAEWAAWGTPGVHKVKNEVSVQY